MAGLNDAPLADPVVVFAMMFGERKFGHLVGDLAVVTQQRLQDEGLTKEARPICTLVRRLAAEIRSGGRRVLSFADSSPNIGAWAKGRSSSGRLGSLLRRVAPDQLLTDLQIAIPYVPTFANPADNPTRGRRVRRTPVEAERSALADALLSCCFDDRTDAAFRSSTLQAAPLTALLEPVTGQPY